MKKRTIILYSLYIWLKIFYGVTFHPYRTLWEIRRRPVLVPILASPFFTLASIFILGKIGSILVFVAGSLRVLIAIILGGAIISILLWQLLLFYFLANFLFASYTKEKT